MVTCLTIRTAFREGKDGELDAGVVGGGGLV